MQKEKLTKEELLSIHKAYEFDTDAEGKYHPEDEGITRVNKIKELVPSQSIVLEVGCNSGGLLRLIRNEKNIVAYGIEINPKLAKIAQQKGIIAVNGDAEKLPYKDGFFDVCMVTEVLEHLYDDIACFKEMMRVLKKGGLFISTVPHPDGFIVKKRSLEKHIYHVRNYSVSEYKKLLKLGLKKVKIVNIYSLTANKDINDEKIDSPRWLLGYGVKR